jgi:DNA processing protein
MQLTKDQELTVLWSMLHEPGDGLAREIFDSRGPKAIEDFRTQRASRLWPECVGEEYTSHIPELLERIELRLSKINVIERIERGIRWNARIYFEDSDAKLFQKLRDLGPHRPYLLWIAGDASILSEETVSIVGTRNPSGTGLASAKKLVAELLSPVISGGAVGIDAEAHKSAIDLGLQTAAFMAGGVDKAYPQANWELFHTMVQAGGALISEVSPGTTPSRFRFLQRNRLIAAASSATYIVEAGYRSGTRNTANHARVIGREVFAVPGPWAFAPARGANAMIAEGLARPYPLTSFPVELSMNQKRIQDAMRAGARFPDEIAAESGLSLASVLEELKPA